MTMLRKPCAGACRPPGPTAAAPRCGTPAPARTPRRPSTAALGRHWDGMRRRMASATQTRVRGCGSARAGLVTAAGALPPSRPRRPSRRRRRRSRRRRTPRRRGAGPAGPARHAPRHIPAQRCYRIWPYAAIALQQSRQAHQWSGVTVETMSPMLRWTASKRHPALRQTTGSRRCGADDAATRLRMSAVSAGSGCDFCGRWISTCAWSASRR